ncbi:MAG: ABC transporter permease [Clostridiaceae bacterium]
MNSIVIAINLIKRMLKEINIFGFIFFLPILAAVLAVVMFGNTEKVTVGIANFQSVEYSLVEYLKDSGKYDIRLFEEGQIEEKVKDKDIEIGVIFQKEFSSNSKDKIKIVSLNNNEDVQMLRGEIEGYLAVLMSGKEMIEYEKVTLKSKEYEKGRASIGLLSMFILMFAGSSIGFLLEDKREKNFMRLFSTPVKEYEVVLAHIMANFLLGILQVTLFLVVSTFVFKIKWGISPLWVFVILAAYLVTSVGFSVGLVGVVDDSEKYNLILTLTAIVTSILGGGFFPTDSLNIVIRKISSFMPQKWMVDSYMKLVNGGGISSIQINLLVLLLFGVVFFTFGIKTLRPGERDL